MVRNLKQSIRWMVNSILSAFNLKLVTTKHFTDSRDYIPFQETFNAAAAAGLSMGDYIDLKYNKPGDTQKTIDLMSKLGVFDSKIDRVCEIGPGSGRYLAKILQVCNPSYVEIYETANDWEKYLVATYKIIAQPTDEKTLQHTPSNSIDLVQAHKVMPSLPSLVMCSYFLEMMRIVKKGGKIIFDVVTEACMDDSTLNEWLETGSGYQHYPCIMPKQYVVDLFTASSFSFDGSFIVPMNPGKTECMVFTKR
jgi:hypothetical protein